VSETDVLVLRPAAGPRRQVLTIAAVIAVVLLVAGVLAGGRPALITCISLVLLLAATIAVYLWRPSQADLRKPLNVAGRDPSIQCDSRCSRADTGVTSGFIG
jgi:hypothetical protein